MISEGKRIVDEAKRYQIPVVGILYPRGENAEGGPSDKELEVMKSEDKERFTEIIAHCAMAGVDMGVDLIKTHYTGSIESFKKVIDAAQGIPVVIAGGPIIDKDESIKNAVDAVKAGAAGTSYARNCFGRDNPAEFIAELRSALENEFRT
jgi:DhnA family fructose-bisphosphate aldolase class Ia